MSTTVQRANRIAQAKGRGGRSYKTEMENAYLLLAWEAELLSEGQVASILDLDRVTLRIMRENAIARGLQIAEGLTGERP